MASLSVPPNLRSPRDDAMDLYKAFKGLGCDSAGVIRILAHRDATQRALIQQEYRTMYAEELPKRLKSELTGKFEDAILLWMLDGPGRDSSLTWTALHSDPTDPNCVTDVICSRTPSQIYLFKQQYHTRFGTYLEHDIRQFIVGDHGKLLLAYASTPRHEGPEVQIHEAENDAKMLYKAGEKRIGTDEDAFIRIFSQRSAAHLVAVAAAYKKAYGRSLKKAIKKETSGFFEQALLTILKCAENPPKYFAKALYKAMKGFGTDDSTLIRTIVTRTEIDMAFIKAQYLKKYKKTLSQAVHSDTSGNYRAFILELIGPN